MNVFFDLDGTLLDSKRRLYVLFQELAPESTLSFDEYWELKRKKTDHKTILTKRFNYTEKDFDRFEKKYLEKIELCDYLRFDTPVDGLYDVLNELVQKNVLYIVTSRQSKENVLIQLKKLNMYEYFNDILVTEHRCEKNELLSMLVYRKEDFFVGDTGYDILTGSRLGMHTVAVSYGFINKEKLSDYSPEFIIDSLPEIAKIII